MRVSSGAPRCAPFQAGQPRAGCSKHLIRFEMTFSTKIAGHVVELTATLFATLFSLQLEKYFRASSPNEPKPTMSLSPFLLGTTLIFVAATIAVIRVMPSSGASEEALPAAAENPRPLGKPGVSSDSVPSFSASRTPRSGEPGVRPDLSLESSAMTNVAADNRLRVSGILAAVQRKSGEKLDQLSEIYALTRKQRAAIYPLIVAHDTQAHPAILVGGRPIPKISAGLTLDESIHAELTPDQRDLLTGNTLERDAWWTEVASQLRDDLNNSLSDGEVSAPPIARNPSSVVPGIVPSSGPAQGDGQASDRAGENLFDLLNGN